MQVGNHDRPEIAALLQAVDAADVGAAVRQARERARMSLRKAAPACLTTKSTLQRIEEDGRLPHLSEAANIDDGLGLGGTLEAAVGRIRYPNARRPDTSHFHSFPAGHVGAVYMYLSAPKAGRPAPTVAWALRWGPWQAEKVTALTDMPQAWWFTKSDDGKSVPLFLNASSPIWTRWSVTPPDDVVVHDLNNDAWRWVGE